MKHTASPGLRSSGTAWFGVDVRWTELLVFLHDRGTQPVDQLGTSLSQAGEALRQRRAARSYPSRG